MNERFKHDEGTAAGAMRRGMTRKALFALLVALVLAAFVVVPGCSDTPSSPSSSEASQSSGPVVSTAEDAIPVSVTIDASAHGDGVLFDGVVTIDPEGATVKDALLATGLQVTSKNSLGMGYYVAGIGTVMEKDKAPTSGWIYSINDQKGTTSCDNAPISAGDHVKWVWMLDGVTQ